MSEAYPRESQTMGLVGHLDELRRRILICLVFLFAAVVILFYRVQDLVALLEAPAHSTIKEFVFLRPAEAFVASFQVVLLTAFLACFPVLLYQLWAFIAPALSKRHRRSALLWLTFACVSFFGGIVFAYAVLLPVAFNFLITFGRGMATPIISLGEYISFAVITVFMGGAVFEIPAIMGLLTEIGLLRSATLRRGRRYAILIIFCAAAILTPTQDAVNLLLFAVPMVFLYEVGISVSRWVESRKTRTNGEEEE